MNILQSKNNKSNEYKKQHSKLVALRFFNSKDADIIAKLESVPSKLDYIRQLIREDIARHSEDTSDTKKDTE